MTALRNARFAAAALAVLALAGLLAFASGCGDDDDNPVGPGPTYSSIVITGPDSVLVGQNVSFTATVLDTAGQPVANPQLAWTSSGTGVATVSSAGVAHGVSEGDVTITASGGGISSGHSLAVYPGYGWIDQSDALPSLRNLKGLYFVNAREGWIVGDLGTIFHTTDAGQHWSSQNSNSTSYTLNDVAFVNHDMGVVVGSAGRVLRTINGGTTWNVVTVDSDGGKSLNRLFFQDANRGWIVGNGGIILRTNNGGASWTRVLPAVTTVDLHDVAFPNAFGTGNPPADPFGKGWAVGAQGTILASNDFGQDWRVYVPFQTTDELFGVATQTTGQSIAVGANNRVLYTQAVLDTFVWNLAPAPNPPANFTTVSFPQNVFFPLPFTKTGAGGAFPIGLGSGSPYAWAVGKRTDSAMPVVMYSEDSGLTWVAQQLPNDAPLSGNTLEDIFFIDPTHAWAVGSQGLVLHTVNGGR
jgi:photosystem II stability/assembly factor-like uncharacterized protein